MIWQGDASIGPFVGLDEMEGTWWITEPVELRDLMYRRIGPSDREGGGRTDFRDGSDEVHDDAE